MPVFLSEQDVYDKIGRLFEELLADPQLGPQLQRADTIVQYRCREPQATVTVDVRRDSEPRAVMGPTDLEPEVVLTMSADTAHQLFLGQVNVTVALARGQLEARGPVMKVLKLVPLIRPMFTRYRAQLEAEGQADLVTA